MLPYHVPSIPNNHHIPTNPPSVTPAATKLPIAADSALLLIIPNPFPNQKSIKSLLAILETVFTGASILLVPLGLITLDTGKMVVPPVAENDSEEDGDEERDEEADEEERVDVDTGNEGVDVGEGEDGTGVELSEDEAGVNTGLPG